MSGIRYWDKHGEEIAFRVWCELFADAEYCRVDITDVGNGVEVSTVWLGMDHGFGRTDEPLIFETMIFGTLELNGETSRYHTLEAAEAGHRAAVALVELEMAAK